MTEYKQPEVQAFWWCPKCHEEVSSGRVTCHERHDACGNAVEAMTDTSTTDTIAILRAELEKALLEATGKRVTEYCNHVIEPVSHLEERVCITCQMAWNISECMSMTATQLMDVPLAVRREVMYLQAEALVEHESRESIE
jgi:hypothetical protein